MKGNVVHTIIKSMLILAILIALSATVNAQGPPVNPVGSWQCEIEGTETVVFLVNFNLDGTLTATDSDTATSDYQGAWKRTGLNTFESTDYSFDIPNQCIVETYTISTMTGNDTFVASAKVKDCRDNITEQPALRCTRIQIEPL